MALGKTSHNPVSLLLCEDEGCVHRRELIDYVDFPHIHEIAASSHACAVIVNVLTFLDLSSDLAAAVSARHEVAEGKLLTVQLWLVVPPESPLCVFEK